MRHKKIEQLEGLVDALVKEVRGLRSDNNQLKEESLRLAKELEAVALDVKKNQGKLEKLAVLERSCQKLETGNVAARIKIQNLLAELERADWS